MGDNKEPGGERSKFTPTGNEQGSSAVQPDPHEDGEEEEVSKREELENEEQRGSRKGDQHLEDQDDEEQRQPSESSGIFSTLVGDGKYA